FGRHDDPPGPGGRGHAWHSGDSLIFESKTRTTMKRTLMSLSALALLSTTSLLAQGGTDGAVERRSGAQECLPPMCHLRVPKERPMSAPKITCAMIAAPCAPSACRGVESGHAIRQPALMARPAPAPYRAPATVGRVVSESRNSRLKSKTRIPPAIVLPMPQPKPMIHGESRSTNETHARTNPAN